MSHRWVLVALLASAGCKAEIRVSGAPDAAAPVQPEREPIIPPPAPPPIVITDAAPSVADSGGAAQPVAVCPGGDAPAPTPCAAHGIVIDPAYAGKYSCFDLGSVPGVPVQKYGGLTLTREPCSTTLLIGGQANQLTGKLYKITVRRDRNGNIAGFEGQATVYADAPFNDGGITFGPDGVLFFTRWPSNELQQTKPGSTMADKVVDLTPLGVAHASAAIGFVPPGLPGAGGVKLVSWSVGQWHTLELRPDGMGTFDVTRVTRGLTLPGGPEGFVYVAAGSPLFDVPSMLVSEWSANAVSTYEVDASGDPKLETRKSFITGFRGAEGAYRDPPTGDFFFSTWGQTTADRVIVVRGFKPVVID